MPSSRAIAVLGMHRNGTSVLTRGLQELDVYLGSDFLETRRDNPTGYWENRPIVELNDRILGTLGLRWHSIERITDEKWRDTDLESFRREAADHLQANFLDHPSWGFKDPRTTLLLPFWRPLLESLDVDDCYIVAVRNPFSVADSLYTRQGTGPVYAHQLWLLYMVPQLHRILGRPVVFVDYDLLMADPAAQFARIAERLGVPFGDKQRDAIANFSKTFVQSDLRHHQYAPDHAGPGSHLTDVTQEAHRWLLRLATDEIAFDSEPFWTAWKQLDESMVKMIDEAVAGRKRKAEELRLWREAAERFTFLPRRNFPDVRLFVVTGTQRTGTNLLRELLNTNSSVAMMAEILTPCAPPGNKAPGPPYPLQSDKEEAASYQLPPTGRGQVPQGLNHDAYWGNFLRTLPPESFPAETPADAEALLDRYFEFLLDRIRRDWTNNYKSRATAIGVDIKYSHLRRLAPRQWDPSLLPFLIRYFRSRDVMFIHALRSNLVQCTISDLAMQHISGVCHNYAQRTLDGRFTIDTVEFLGWARRIIRERDRFREHSAGMNIVEYEYDDLARELTRAEPGSGRIPHGDGTLRNIALALNVPFSFFDRGSLKKAINIPYSQLIENYDEFIRAVKKSEFSEYVDTLA